MSDPQTPPTPPLEHARRNALGCMSCQHGPEAEPGNECEACRRVVADFESEVRADERAALAASAGALSAERLEDIAELLGLMRLEGVAASITEEFTDLLTAYTALAAECALVKEQRDQARELHRDALVEYGAMVTRVNAAEGDLAALRATHDAIVRQRDALRDQLYPPHQSGSYPARTTTPEGR